MPFNVLRISELAKQCPTLGSKNETDINCLKHVTARSLGGAGGRTIVSGMKQFATKNVSIVFSESKIGHPQ